ncbi:hypothetical protein AAGS61_02330 [Lysinibacillus sp. KU-BSD001]|uniref:hypothetical protein n=1 Tax=Lysinibacillus sp. KU-BSD001 TaxID=3141328 RepID=UPI0036E8A73D
MDSVSSLWDVNIGHVREEIAEVAKEQMSTLVFSSCFATFKCKRNQLYVLRLL